MNRRELFRGIVGVGAGLVLPASLEANAETARRWWSLGAVPGRDPCIIDMWEQDFIVSDRFDADMAWKTIVIHVERDPLVVQYVKVPSAGSVVDEKLLLARMGLRMWH